MSLFRIEVHHGGHFITTPESKYIDDKISIWKEDYDLWSYWECLDRIKELGYAYVERVWYKIGGKGLDARLKQLTDNKGAMEMARIGQCHGLVQEYLEHPILEPILANSPEVRLVDGDGTEVAMTKGNGEEANNNMPVEENGGDNESDDSAYNI